MKRKNLWIITMIVSSLFLVATFPVEAADVTITDGIEDVSSVDYLTGETTVVTSSPDITVDDLDLIKATYTQQAIQATVSLQVKGNIADRGEVIDMNSEDTLTDLDTVEYGFQLTTSEQDYSVSYSNKTGQLVYGDEQINLTSSDFSVVGDTLTISFELASAGETYTNLSVTSTYIKANFSSIDTSGLVYLSDVAPNPTLAVYEAYASNIGSVGESIQFNGSVEPLTGQPPYTYHWDFGDQGSSTQLNPTHTYKKAGVYTYTFTVTDNGDATARESGNITISTEGGGGTNNSLSSQMILFLAILLIIVVIGVVVIVWIIRR
jgi:PKD domain